MINNLVKNNIKNNLVYHASPFKLDILSGAKTSKWPNETGNVFVTPCKGIAACFLINKNQILDKLSQQFQGKIIGLNFGYDVWNKPVQQLYTIPNNINILLNLPGIKPFSGSSTGYVYTIDFSKYRTNCHMFNKNPDSDVEFLIEGNVKFIKCEQVTINWTCMSSQQQIKRKGTAKVIQVYDPPYTYEQMLNAGYSQKIANKLKNDPVHGWRMQTRIKLIHKQPSLAEQKRIWKNWQLMTPEQKEISQKKSIELFGRTNKQHYKEIMQNYWKEPIFQSIIKTGELPIIIHPEPNLDDQRLLWKQWQAMLSVQKKLSDKKSLEFYGMTNKEHHNFIMKEYYNAPIFQSKFQKLFYLILESYDAEYLPIYSKRCIYIKQSGHCIDRFLERFWNTISKSELLKLLQNIFIEIDKLTDIKLNIYCDKSLIMMSIIISNNIGNILTIRQMELWQQKRNKNILHPEFIIIHLNI